MSLADKVHAEQVAITAGTAKVCGATQPDVAASCVRAEHLPEDEVHAGTLADGTLIQWAAYSSDPAPAPADLVAAAEAAQVSP